MEQEFEMKPMEESESKDGGALACASGCPLSRIPLKTWKQLFREPFRCRHPLIYWASILIFSALLLYSLSYFFIDENETDSNNCLALVKVQGPIMNPEPVLAWIRKLENMSGVKGILLRVDSPGGGAAASQEIYSALARISAKKPIVVSMGAMAASGGLMVSMAGEKIFANPSTITGSIGVRMDIPQVQGLMDKIGIGQETLVTAPFKDAASYMHPLSPEARSYLEKVLMNMHDQFVGIVAKGRKMDFEKARELANGKIFTGEQALALGLVDAMGGQYEAHKWLSEKTGIEQTQALLNRKDSQKGLIELLSGAASAFGLDTSFLDRLGQGSNPIQPVFLYQF